MSVVLREMGVVAAVSMHWRIAIEQEWLLPMLEVSRASTGDAWLIYV
jgi:hypothetical protein